MWRVVIEKGVLIADVKFSFWVIFWKAFAGFLSYCTHTSLRGCRCAFWVYDLWPIFLLLILRPSVTLLAPGLPSNRSFSEFLHCTHSDYGVPEESHIIIFRYYLPVSKMSFQMTSWKAFAGLFSYCTHISLRGVNVLFGGYDWYDDATHYIYMLPC